MAFLSKSEWFSKLSLLFNDGGEATAAEFREINSDLKDSVMFFENIIPVRTPSDFGISIDSSKVYIIDGNVDMGTTEIEVPIGGITIISFSFTTSSLFSSESDYTFLKSAPGGSGDVLIKNTTLSFSGNNSKVYDLTGNSGNEALEISYVNFNSCSSLGEVSSHRQILEDGTGRFGGKPELTLSGNFGGLKISNSIVAGIEQSTILIKEGTALSISGRVITDINCDLSTGSSLLDFSETDFVNDESLQIQGAFLRRNGIVDSNDTNIILNIDENSVKSNWKNNTGINNTQKHIALSCTLEIETPILFQGVFYPLLGTQVIQNPVHFDSPNNGEARAIAGSSNYRISGNIEMLGTQSNELILRVIKSEDDGTTWTEEVNRLTRQVLNLTGLNDLALFPISFETKLNKNDRLRLEILNSTNDNNATLRSGSYWNISSI